MAIGRPGSVNEIIEMEKELGVDSNIFAKLKSENDALKLKLEEANHRIAMLEDELAAAEEELAMIEDDESRHV